MSRVPHLSQHQLQDLIEKQQLRQAELTEQGKRPARPRHSQAVTKGRPVRGAIPHQQQLFRGVDKVQAQLLGSRQSEMIYDAVSPARTRRNRDTA